MPYVLTSEGEPVRWPYSLDDLRKDRADLEIPDKPDEAILDKLGVYPLAEAEPPASSLTKRCIAEPPQLVDDKWTPSWRVESIDVAVVKAQMSSAVNKLRDAKQDGQVTTPFGVFDCNERSRQFIHGGVTEGMLRQAAGDATPIAFTTADNKDVQLAPAEMIAAGRMVMGLISAIHFHARQLKAKIESATDEALDGIDINAGWPE